MEYFEIIVEMDYIHWQLMEFQKRNKKKSGIIKMIDETTGYDKTELKQAIKLVKRFKKLEKLLKRQL